MRTIITKLDAIKLITKKLKFFRCLSFY